MTFADFQFLRPEWLWAIIPAALIGWMLLRHQNAGSAAEWTKLVDAHLLKQLTIGGAQTKRSRILPFVVSVMAAAAIIGLAGPTWHERAVPSYEGGTPVVAALSLAQSMNANDLKPSRLARSVHKLRDILDRTEGDERGLVIYADTPFVAAPLTSDPEIISQMLPELSTSLMPVLGNRLDLAISEAHDMLTRAGAVRGDIIVMADDAGNDAGASIAAARAAARDGFTVSVLGAGTEEGAVLQTADGRAIAGQDGQTYMTALAREDLAEVAQAGDGAFSMITPNDADLDRVLPDNSTTLAGDKQDIRADSHVDMGYLLLILPVLLMPLAFRRGLVFSLAVVASGAMMQPNAAQASVWKNLWATADQQGQTAFAAQDFAGAASAFENPDWKGAAAYRAGDYVTAAGLAGSDYNRGNALAKAGQLEQALAAYDAALEATPDDGDAQFNRDLIADLLKQQEQEQQQQDQEQQQSQGQQQSGGGDSQQDQQSSGEDQAQDQSDQGEAGQDPQSGNDQRQPDQGQEAGNDPLQAGQQGDESTDGQDQQQASQEPSGDQGQAEAEQAGQDPQDRADAQQQQAEYAGGAQPQAGVEQTAQQAQPGQQQASDQEGENGLSQTISDLLGEDDATTQEQVEASAPGAQPIDQAIEQQLRRVPDDPSGLLRARIRQHYAQMRRGG